MIINGIVIILLIIGCFFFIVGTIGILRMPDIFTRLHPSTKCDTIGAGSIILAMIVYGGWSIDIPKLVAIGFFLLVSSATCGHAIARSVLKKDKSSLEKDFFISEQKEEYHSRNS